MLKKIFITLILGLTLAQPFYPIVVSAQKEYTVLAPLPGTYKGENKTDIKTYIEGLFSLLIALSAVFAVFMIVIGGFQYMTSDAIGGKNEGRARIENSIKGLILVIGAWLILAQIDERLLTVNIDITAANVPAPAGGGGLSGPSASSATVAQKVAQTCPSCSATRNDLSYNMSQSYINGLSCTTCAPISNTIPFNGNSNTNVLPDTNNKLVTMQGSLPSNISWRVSEAYPPVVQHANGCHSRGTCVDISFGSTPATGANVNAVINSASSSGLKAIYEVKDTSTKNQLVNSGVPASSIMVVSTINSSHFSVYNCSADPQSCANLP